MTFKRETELFVFFITSFVSDWGRLSSIQEIKSATVMNCLRCTTEISPKMIQQFTLG